MLRFDGSEINKVKIPYIYPDLYYNKMPYKFCKQIGLLIFFSAIKSNM